MRLSPSSSRPFLSYLLREVLAQIPYTVTCRRRLVSLSHDPWRPDFPAPKRLAFRIRTTEKKRCAGRVDDDAGDCNRVEFAAKGAFII